MSGPHPVVYLAVITLVLFGTALLLPSNDLTGFVAQEPSCGALGCSELCDVGSASCSQSGMVCCATAWGTGVCDYEQDCAIVNEYSQRMSLTQYQDTVREEPSPVSSDWARFLVPLVVVLGLAVWAVMSARSKKRPLR